VLNSKKKIHALKFKIKFVNVQYLIIIIIFCFHRQLNLIWRSGLTSSGFSLLPIAVAISYYLNQLMIVSLSKSHTQYYRDATISFNLNQTVKKCVDFITTCSHWMHRIHLDWLYIEVQQYHFILSLRSILLHRVLSIFFF
jgi:hypothetical protein